MRQSGNFLLVMIHKIDLLSHADLERFLAIRNRRVILDTNIIIQGCTEAHKSQRQAIETFSIQNVVRITETIHYEFLRNLSIDSFRRRYRALWEMVGGRALAENDPLVQKWFRILTLVYFFIMKRNVNKLIFDSQENDRWITATALGYGISHILTTDHGNGFPMEIFDDEVFDLSTNTHRLHLHCKKVNVDNIVRYWKEIQERGGIHLSIP